MALSAKAAAQSSENRFKFIVFVPLEAPKCILAPKTQIQFSRFKMPHGEKFGTMPPMATRQQQSLKSKPKTNNGPTIFGLIVVLGLIGLVFYFGFIKVN